MIESINYKKQGNGQDSWIVTYDSKRKDIIYFLTVDNWKIKCVLSKQGLLKDVELALDNLPEPEKTNANFAWNFAPTIDSNASTTLFIMGVLGLNLEQMMGIFVEAINFKI